MGPLLDFIRSRGGSRVGVTLSSAQAAACRRHGLDIHLQDAREVSRDTLPHGQEQVVRCAEPHFGLVSSVSGRLDYIETIHQWRKRIAAPSLKKTLLKLQLLPRWLTSADFRLAFTSGASADSVCFERELLDHYRLVFEKKPSRSG